MHESGAVPGVNHAEAIEMTTELLEQVKSMLGITGTYQNGTITGYIEEVEAFLNDAGVPSSRQTPGVISAGVADLWNYGAGDRKFSNAFMMRAIQLAAKG